MKLLTTIKKLLFKQYGTDKVTNTVIKLAMKAYGKQLDYTKPLYKWGSGAQDTTFRELLCKEFKLDYVPLFAHYYGQSELAATLKTLVLYIKNTSH